MALSIVTKTKIIFRYLLNGEVIVLFQKLIKHYLRRKTFLKSKGQSLSNRNFLNKSKDQASILVFDHLLGGGANFFRDEYIENQLKQNKTIILVVNSIANGFYACFISKTLRYYSKFNNLSTLFNTLQQLQSTEIAFNNALSYPNCDQLPQYLLTLKHTHQAKLSFFLHDFMAICPSYNLLNYRNEFCNIPELTQCMQCLAKHQGHFKSLIENRDIENWRAKWGALLTASDKIISFSQNSTSILLKAYPTLDPQKIHIKPHQVRDISAIQLTSQDSFLHIGILGHINRIEKGSGIIKELVALIEQENIAAKITVFGSFNKAPKSPVIKVLGPYKRANLPSLIQKSGVNVFLMPSIWPETFSYVTEELIQMNVPLAVFNLGAPAERVQEYPKGLIISKICAKTALNELLNFCKFN